MSQQHGRSAVLVLVLLVTCAHPLKPSNDRSLLPDRSSSTNKLVELDLGYNEIKDDGACALAQVC